jgi:hypothetical protein
MNGLEIHSVLTAHRRLARRHNPDPTALKRHSPHVPIKFAENHRGFGRGILGQIVAGHFGIGFGVDQPDVGVHSPDRSSVLRCLGLVDGHGEGDLLHIRRDPA